MLYERLFVVTKVDYNIVFWWFLSWQQSQVKGHIRKLERFNIRIKSLRPLAQDMLPPYQSDVGSIYLVIEATI